MQKQLQNYASFHAHFSQERNYFPHREGQKGHRNDITRTLQMNLQFYKTNDSDGKRLK